jgi:ribosome-binding protein aMBF1 (putative translation factor)
MDPTPHTLKRPTAPPPGVSLPKGLCAVFGNNLREARIEAGLSQKDLAAATWITQACGSAWNFDPVTGVIGVQN